MKAGVAGMRSRTVSDAKIQTFNFRKVVRQHTEGMVESILWVCWQFISLSSSERILKIR